MNLIRKCLIFYLSVLPLWTNAGKKQEFSIYLVTDPLDDRQVLQGSIDVSKPRLSPKPLLSGEDILGYNWTTHSIRLRPEAFKRLPSPGVFGVPFVVVVNGERIYIGVFMTNLSSASAAIPSIVERPSPLEDHRISYTVVIERAYPVPSFGVGADPRPDPRIKKALAALGKLENAPTD